MAHSRDPLPASGSNPVIDSIHVGHSAVNTARTPNVAARIDSRRTLIASRRRDPLMRTPLRLLAIAERLIERAQIFARVGRRLLGWDQLVSPCGPTGRPYGLAETTPSMTKSIRTHFKAARKARVL